MPWRRLRLETYSFEELLALLDEADLLLPVQPELRVEPLERCQVHPDLLRQLADVAGRVLAERPFLPIELLLGPTELRAQELRRSCRLAGAHEGVLRDVERCDGVGDVGDRLAGVAREAQAERHRLHAAADLLRSRLLNDDVVARLREGFLDPLPFPELRIEIEAVYELREAIAAQDFLFDHVQAAFELAADRGLEDRFRYRPLDEYHRRPAIELLPDRQKD